jgi:multiple sugar transport system ATP-binding protein
MASVTFEAVSKVYPDGTRALADCTLDVADGEFVVVVGSSGCGKSTLLRLLAGLEPITSGTLRIDGRIANDLTPQERNVAMVFQDYALYPFKTVRGNLEFPLQMRRLPRDEIGRRVERTAALLDIGALLDRLPRQLSGGQRQRVAMGRALVREPTAFLLDEPLSNLDAKLRAQVRAEIAELQRRTRTTTLYVTHDQVEALTLAHRVAVLHGGRLQQVARPADLYTRPANTFVAGFIGAPPMNLFSLRLASRAYGRRPPSATPTSPTTPSAMGGLDPAAIPAPGTTTALLFAGGALAIPARHPIAALAATHAGQTLTGGIRPESIRLVDHDAAETTFAGTVERVEHLGHETLAEVRVGGVDAAGGMRLTARMPGMHALARDAPVRLQLPLDRFYLFGPDGRLLLGP